MVKSLRFLASLGILTWSQFLGVAWAKSIDLALGTGDVLRVEAVAPGILRVRLSADSKFEPSLMERYGIVRTAWPECDVSVREESGVTRIDADSGALEVRTSDGTMRLLGRDGAVLCEQIVPQASHLSGARQEAFKARQAALAEHFKGEKRKAGQIQIIGSTAEDKTEYSESMHEFDLPDASFGATFSLRDAERFYGLGTASSYRLQLRGHAYRLWTQYRGNFGYRQTETTWEQTEGPIPLLFSTGGWGVFVNTTWVHYYDIGRYEADKMFFWGPGGNLDFYLLIGETLPTLIERYTEITGKPRLLPLFGYGLSYVGQILQNEHEILNDARLFRDRGIPCDVMGLEPQWMKKYYDASHEKEWNPDKFYVPAWMGPDSKGHTFIGGLDRIGFKLSLWLVCDDDLTVEEERQVAIREGQGDSFPAEPEAWFNHLRKFVRNGARAFKMDPSSLIQEHSKRQYYNGRCDLENHNLTQILYHKQMALGYEQFTNRRAMNHYCAAYAGVQYWGATTMGDNGGGQKALTWMLNYAMSGHMNTSCDMQTLGQGIHFGFLQPWSQHNNWASASQPWFLGKQGEAIYHGYARLRYSLIPYIYSAAYEGHRTGMPIVRPMPLVYPEALNLADSTNQYMLGPSLLVVAFSDTVSLPKGRWIDYWTGAEYEGPREMPCTYPENRAGGLFIRSGAIIPYWPEMDFVGERPVETISLHVYPEGRSEYTLYEDDGDSLEYLKGSVATTSIQCQAQKNGVVLTIDPRRGEYRGMPSNRSYEVSIHTDRPKAVTVTGGAPTLAPEWSYDVQRRMLCVRIGEDPSRKAGIVIQCDL